MTNIRLHEILGLSIGLIAVLFLLWLTFGSHQKCCACQVCYDNNIFDGNDCCCPCPNTKLTKELEQVTGMKAGSSFAWQMMCNEYEEITNKSIQCWEE